MKVFQIDDCTWYAAETMDDAIHAYTNDTGILYDEVLRQDEEYDCLRELSEEAMNRLKFTDAEHEFSEDGRDFTFAEALQLMIARGDQFPSMFASTEY